MPQKRRKRYSALFQQRAVERMRLRESVRELARELGVSRSTLYAWKRKADSSLLGGRPPHGALAESDEPRPLGDLENWVTLLEVIEAAARTQRNGRLENPAAKPKKKARRAARSKKRDRPPG